MGDDKREEEQHPLQNLEGFRIPGAIERLITSLFADDTTVYLSEDDDYAELMNILDTWCAVSGAKFNIAKNERGSGKNKMHQRVDGTPIPDGIRILKDGEAARTLGAMVGNGICVYEPWARVLEKINKTLVVWEKGHPTMEGRRLIAQMMIGGISQYPAKVQGMPKDVEDRMEKRVRKFLWAEKTNPTVNKETIYAPFAAGGRKLLDIKARNEAINVMWLKSYLK
ncbi:hypothetical protein BDZ89DRAFT_1091965 [Hymenopellis radicata]|nr:hypothetical protein BDZ89DRAFT_1091965 [Hymenopellis radicata]